MFGNIVKWANLGFSWLGIGMAIYSLTDEDKTNDPTADVLAMQTMAAFKATMETAGVKEIDDEWMMKVTPHFSEITKITMEAVAKKKA